jgi:hypothetical protein
VKRIQNEPVGGKKMAPQSSDTNNQKTLLRLLDRVAETGVPMEIQRKGKRLLVSPAEKKRKLDLLEPHPEFIVGNPDALVHIDWSSEWEPNL